MNPYLITLYNLQLADTHIRIAQTRIQKLDWGEAIQETLMSNRGEARALAQTKADAQRDLKELEAEIARIESRMIRSQKRIDKGDVHNEHELESTEKELVQLGAQKIALEEKAIAHMETLDAFPAQAAAIIKKERDLTGQIEQIRRQSTMEKNHLEDEIVAVSKRRASLSAELPASVLQKYDYMRARMGGVAIVRVVQQSCDACHVVVPGYTLTAIKESVELAPCEGCGRILYTE